MWQWVIGYVVNLIFWLWVVRWGGADLLEGTFASGCLVSWFAPRWSADGIRVFGWCTLFVSTIGFIVGLFWPGFRSSLV